jgi:hypothetical protein
MIAYIWKQKLHHWKWYTECEMFFMNSTFSANTINVLFQNALNLSTSIPKSTRQVVLHI